MSQFARARPFGESEFADELGRHPRDFVCIGMLARERRGLALRALEPAPEALQEFVVVTGTDLSRVTQFIVIVIADEQGAKPLAAGFRLREAADDEFLAGCAFELEPGAGVAVDILGRPWRSRLPIPFRRLP